ncbi:MAG: hypothetical protein ACR2LI_04070 [Propionibacteriaceae bacterium]
MAHRPFAMAPSASSRSTLRRGLLAVGAGLAALALAACGFNVQTNQPYTPSEGVNADVGSYQAVPAVKVRNLMILTRTQGTGFLSASIGAAQPDEALTAVSATELNADGSDGAVLTVALTGPVVLGNNLVVLTDRAPITVTGPLQAGYTARVTLTFNKAGRVSIVAPVIDANTGPYATVSPPATTTSSS